MALQPRQRASIGLQMPMGSATLSHRPADQPPIGGALGQDKPLAAPGVSPPSLPRLTGL